MQKCRKKMQKKSMWGVLQFFGWEVFFKTRTKINSNKKTDLRTAILIAKRDLTALRKRKQIANFLTHVLVLRCKMACTFV